MNTGKSFLMNMLMDDPDFFKVRGGRNERCTVGADISRCMPASAFWGVAASGLPHVAFVDAEGQGKLGPDYDTTLLTPLGLLSKAIILNFKGSPTKHDMLVKLGLLTQAAERIVREPTAASGDPASRGKLFGHLHIVVRDDYSDKADVERIILHPEEGEGNELACRNTIRQLLHHSFKSINVHILPPPIKNTKLLVKGLFTQADVTHEFKEEVNKLKVMLVSQMQQPRVLMGRPPSGNVIVHLMRDIAKGLNEGSSKILPGSAFERIEAEDVKSAVSAILALFEGATTAMLVAQLPLLPAELKQKLQE